MLVRRHLDDPLREGGLSVLTPFMAFLLAELVHVSGVVAVVVAGLVLTYAARASSAPARARRRSRSGTWRPSCSTAALFVLVGLQFHRAAENLDSTSLADALMISLAITGVVIVTRLVWVHLAAFVIRAVDRRAVQRTRRVGWRQRTALGWAGFRGAVSLATALAVPMTVGGGAAFPDRDLLVFTTSVVILLTIVVQGTTLPAGGAVGPAARGHRARRGAVAGPPARRRRRLAALPRLATDLGVDGEHLDRLRAEYEEHRELAADETGDNETMRDRDRKLRLAVLWEKRQTVTALRDANEIDDIVLRELQAQMDVEEVRLLGPVTPD